MARLRVRELVGCRSFIIRLFPYACLCLLDFSSLVLLTLTRFAGDFDSLYLHRDLGPRIVKASQF